MVGVYVLLGPRCHFLRWIPKNQTVGWSIGILSHGQFCCVERVKNDILLMLNFIWDNIMKIKAEPGLVVHTCWEVDAGGSVSSGLSLVT